MKDWQNWMILLRIYYQVQKLEMELESIPDQTGNGIMTMYTNQKKIFCQLIADLPRGKTCNS